MQTNYTDSTSEMHYSPERVRAALARSYGRRAAIALQHGHVAAAERLAWQAVALREGGA